MADPFARMTERLHARLGVEALLRASQPVRVILSRGVAILGEQGLLVAYRDVADILSADDPHIGEKLQVGTDAYVIDSVEANDGYSVRCVLRKDMP